jgi:hypothetical protein
MYRAFTNLISPQNGYEIEAGHSITTSLEWFLLAPHGGGLYRRRETGIRHGPTSQGALWGNKIISARIKHITL